VRNISERDTVTRSTLKIVQKHVKAIWTKELIFQPATTLKLAQACLIFKTMCCYEYKARLPSPWAGKRYQFDSYLPLDYRRVGRLLRAWCLDNSAVTMKRSCPGPRELVTGVEKEGEGEEEEEGRW
jgi:hypothetical protein